MIKKTHLVLAREARLFVIAIIAIAAIIHFLAGSVIAIPFWIWAAVWAYMFRDTHRGIPPAPMGIVGPCDGRILSVEKARDFYLNRDAWKIRLKMNRLGEFAVRSPTEGKVMNRWYVPAGEPLLSAPEQQASDSIRPYTRHAIWIRTDEGDDVVLASETTRWKKPNWYIHEGWRVGQGQRCGYIPFGAEIEVYVPANAEMEKIKGQNVVAGCDVIAKLRYPTYPTHQQMALASSDETD